MRRMRRLRRRRRLRRLRGVRRVRRLRRLRRLRREEKHHKTLKYEEGVPTFSIRPLRFAVDRCSGRKRLPPRQCSLEEERQNGCALFLYGLKSARIKAQRFQDCRRDLRRGNWGLHHFGTETRVRNNEANVGVTETETAVLGVFLGRTRVGRAVNRLY